MALQASGSDEIRQSQIQCLAVLRNAKSDLCRHLMGGRRPGEACGKMIRLSPKRINLLVQVECIGRVGR